MDSPKVEYEAETDLVYISLAPDSEMKDLLVSCL